MVLWEGQLLLRVGLQAPAMLMREGLCVHKHVRAPASRSRRPVANRPQMGHRLETPALDNQALCSVALFISQPVS